MPVDKTGSKIPIRAAGGALTNQIAAFLSTPFDVAGALGILFLGAKGRTRLLFCLLTALAALIYILPKLAHQQLWIASLAIGVIGFLSCGPYSLLAGVTLTAAFWPCFCTAQNSSAYGLSSGVVTNSIRSVQLKTVHSSSNLS